MLLPLIAIIFEEDGLSSSLNGLHATSLYIGVLFVSPLIENLPFPIWLQTNYFSWRLSCRSFDSLVSRVEVIVVLVYFAFNHWNW